jgi:hypothetical protein
VLEPFVTSIRLSLVLVLLLAFSGQACAQFGGGGSRRGTGGAGGDGRTRATEPSSEVTRLNANDQVRLQITDVRLALKLSPEQATSWKAYEDKVLSLLDDLSRGGQVATDGNALKQIDNRVGIVRNRLAAMEDISDAASKLYAGLSVEQKAVADRALPGTVPTLYSGSGASPIRQR